MGPFFLGVAMSVVIYLDESGDLGWKFSRAYRAGGSSRHISISAILVPNTAPLNLLPHPKRVVRDLYTAHKWPVAEEKKWSLMTPDERVDFTKRLNHLCNKHQAIRLFSVVAWKQGVTPPRSEDPNLLYNYMIKRMLLDEMAKHDQVVLVPDPRSIKVKSGNSLRDYLQTELHYTKEVDTRLLMQQVDSKQCHTLQLTDMLAGAVQAHYEDNKSTWYDGIKAHLTVTELFFPAKQEGG